MAVPTFSEYTYKISYKATSSSAEVILSEELRIIEAKTNIIDGSGASVEAPNPNYDYFMTALVCKVTPQKNTTLIIKRNAIRDGESIIAEEQTIYSGNFDFLDYDRRMGILFQDTEVGQSTKYKILAQILNVNDMERIPCKYVFTGVEFTNNPNIAQHIDIAYRAANATDLIALDATDSVPIANTVTGYTWRGSSCEFLKGGDFSNFTGKFDFSYITFVKNVNNISQFQIQAYGQQHSVESLIAILDGLVDTSASPKSQGVGNTFNLRKLQASEAGLAAIARAKAKGWTITSNV